MYAEIIVLIGAVAKNHPLGHCGGLPVRTGDA